MKINKYVRNIHGIPLITKKTQFVLEGYYRSGNTFAILAFMQAQEQPVIVANHTHAIATLILAAKRKLPTLVLIRCPSDTVISAVLKHPGTDVEQHLRWYIRYYKNVYELRENFHIAHFEEVTNDFGEVIKKVNLRFGTNFGVFKHTPENVQKVLNRIERDDRNQIGGDIGRISIPLTEKNVLKAEVRERLRSKDYTSLLIKAENLYQAIVDGRCVSSTMPATQNLTPYNRI